MRSDATPTDTLTTEAALAPRSSLFEGAAFHLVLAAAFVAAQVALVSTRTMGADNSWHFQFARDILAGGPVFWSSVDANRILPDLLIAMMGVALPGGGRYGVWLYYHYLIETVALYVSLAVLAATVFDRVGQRRTFLFLSACLLTVFLLVSSFWSGWLLVPGNHGGGVPVCLLCLAWVFSMLKRDRADLWEVAGFVIVTSLLVASNRVLLISFVAPLLFALTLAYLAARAGGSVRTGPNVLPTPGDTRRVLPRLIAMTAVAAGAGLVAWRVAAGLPWHKLMQRGSLAPFDPTAEWLDQRLQKEVAELTTANWDVLFGIGLLVVTIPIALGLFAAAGRRVRSPEAQIRTVLGVFTALAGLMVMIFVFAMVDDAGDWRYRYLAVPTVFALVFLASLPFWSGRVQLSRGRLAIAAAVVLPGILGLAFLTAERRRQPDTHDETVYETSIADLARNIARRSTNPRLRGFAEYWIAGEISARSNVLRLTTIHQSNTLEFRPYNNNAADLCEEHFFILFTTDRDEPKKPDVIALVGEPITTETFKLARGKSAVVHYYDPAVLRERLIEPAKRRMTDRFPAFRCAA